MPVTMIKLIRAHTPQTYSMRRIRVENYKPSAWGDMLKTIRTDQGISQRQLAHMAHVNRNALRRMESNSGPVDMDLLERVACALGFEFDIYPVLKTVHDTHIAGSTAP